jgi:hypothetical protein
MQRRWCAVLNNLPACPDELKLYPPVPPAPCMPPPLNDAGLNPACADPPVNPAAASFPAPKAPPSPKLANPCCCGCCAEPPVNPACADPPVNPAPPPSLLTPDAPAPKASNADAACDDTTLAPVTPPPPPPPPTPPLPPALPPPAPPNAVGLNASKPGLPRNASNVSPPPPPGVGVNGQGARAYTRPLSAQCYNFLWDTVGG